MVNDTVGIAPVNVPQGNFSNATTIYIASGQQAAPSGGFDAASAIAILIPFLIFLIAIYWGMGKRTRKKRAVEVSYNLIALELLVLLLVPGVCNDASSSSCFLSAFLPIAMFGILILFMLHRYKKETEHKKTVAKALADGHVNLSGLLQGRLEHELSKKDAKEKKNKKAAKEETEHAEEKKGPKTESAQSTKKGTAPKAKKIAHRKIDGIFDNVLGKDSKKKTVAKKWASQKK